MSIARAFTTKRPKRDSPDFLQRSLTTKQSGNVGTIRDKISSPVELLSTTNMLSYHAPDLYPSSSPSTASNSEASDSDHKSISSVSTPPSSPNAENEVPELNHLSCYFVQPAPGLTPGLMATKSTPDLKEVTAPKIPTRAPSHTKHSHAKAASLSHKASAPAIGMGHKASTSALRSSLQKFNSMHQQAVANNKQSLHTKQSSISMDSQFYSEAPAKSRQPAMQGLPNKPNQQMPPMQSRARSHSNSKSQPQQSLNQITAELKMSHPFGNELAQVTELAEEFSGGKVEFTDEESAFMAEKGLCKFAAEEYMFEIQGLFVRAFGEIRAKVPPVNDMWI